MCWDPLVGHPAVLWTALWFASNLPIVATFSNHRERMWGGLALVWFAGFLNRSSFFWASPHKLQVAAAGARQTYCAFTWFPGSQFTGVMLVALLLKCCVSFFGVLVCAAALLHNLLAPHNFSHSKPNRRQRARVKTFLSVHGGGSKWTISTSCNWG